MNNPNLIEPGISYWLNNILKSSKKFRERNITIIYNICMAVLFILAVSGFLAYKYKGNLTNAEIQQKNNIKKTYILEKLQTLSDIKKTKDHSMITDLPTFDSPEISILKSKY